MTLLRIIPLFIGLIAMALWYAPSMIWGAKATMMMQAMSDSDADLAEMADQMEDIMRGPAPLAWLRDRAEFRDHFGPEFSTERLVNFEQEIPFDDLLNDGEAVPDPLYFDAYAEARAPRILAPNCASLLETIAISCKSYVSDGRYYEHRTRGPVADLSLAMAYIPSYDMGDPSGVQNGRFRTGSVNFRFEDVEPGIENQMDVLDRALEICASIREFYGNCLISYISFDESIRNEFIEKEGEVTFLKDPNSLIQFSVYVDGTIVSRDDVRTKVEAIGAALPLLPGQV